MLYCGVGWLVWPHGFGLSGNRYRSEFTFRYPKHTVRGVIGERARSSAPRPTHYVHRSRLPRHARPSALGDPMLTSDPSPRRRRLTSPSSPRRDREAGSSSSVVICPHLADSRREDTAGAGWAGVPRRSQTASRGDAGLPRAPKPPMHGAYDYSVDAREH